MRGASGLVRVRPWTVRPWIAGVGVFVAVLTLDTVLKGWAQNSPEVPVCLASWICLAVQPNVGLFLGSVSMAPDTMVSILHWLALPPVLAWLAWRVCTLNHVSLNVPYALAAGGLVGNMADRAEGAVIDWVAVGPLADGRWAFMNIADVALVVSVVWIGTRLVRRRIRVRGGRRNAESGTRRHSRGGDQRAA